MAHYIDVDRDGPIAAIGFSMPEERLVLPPPPRLPVDLPLQLRATPPVASQRMTKHKVIAIAAALAALVIVIARVLV